MRRTVLIVDDHGNFRASARAMLEGEGFRVVGEAADGSEAVRAAGSLAPDICSMSSFPGRTASPSGSGLRPRSVPPPPC